MPKPIKIAIIDYKISNMFSIENALSSLEYKSILTSVRKSILEADCAILPGVGAFPEAMKHIRDLELEDTINDFIKIGKPFIGICLGYQLLFDQSEEIELTSGLKILRGNVRRFSSSSMNMRIPHVGWNSLKIEKNNFLENELNPLSHLKTGDHLYFVHSYYVDPSEKDIVYTNTEYEGITFCSSVIKDNIFACQFHPEKSGNKGLKIISSMLKNL